MATKGRGEWLNQRRMVVEEGSTKGRPVTLVPKSRPIGAGPWIGQKSMLEENSPKKLRAVVCLDFSKGVPGRVIAKELNCQARMLATEKASK